MDYFLSKDCRIIFWSKNGLIFFVQCIARCGCHRCCIVHYDAALHMFHILACTELGFVLFLLPCYISKSTIFNSFKACFSSFGSIHYFVILVLLSLRIFCILLFSLFPSHTFLFCSHECFWPSFDQLTLWFQFVQWRSDCIPRREWVWWTAHPVLSETRHEVLISS